MQKPDPGCKLPIYRIITFFCTIPGDEGVKNTDAETIRIVSFSDNHVSQVRVVTFTYSIHLRPFEFVAGNRHLLADSRHIGRW